MSTTCRTTDCCPPGNNLQGVVIDRHGQGHHGGGGNNGGNDGQPECNVPTVTIAVDTQYARCGDSVTVSWTSADVGTGGTVTVDGAPVTADVAGSKTAVIAAQSTTFTIVATNACGTDTASITVYVLNADGILSASAASFDCDVAGQVITLTYDTWNVGPSGSVSLYRRLTGAGGYGTLLTTLTPNIVGTYDITSLPTAASYTFTLLIGNPCYVGSAPTVAVSLTNATPVVELGVCYDGCNITVLWSVEHCPYIDTKTETLAFTTTPGFTQPTEFIGAGLKEEQDVACPGSVLGQQRTFDPIDYATMFAEGADGGYTATATATYNYAGTIVSDTASICAAPCVTDLECADGTDINPGQVTTTLNWKGYFCGNGVRVYWATVDGEICAYVAASDGVEVTPGYYEGSVTVPLKEGGNAFVVMAVETCRASCLDQNISINNATPSCISGAEYPAQVQLVEDMSTAIAACSSFGDCTWDPADGARVIWDRVLEYDAGAPFGCDFVKYGVASDVKVFGTAGAPAVPSTYLASVVSLTQYDGCKWRLKFQCVCDIGYDFSYEHNGVSPYGSYTMVDSMECTGWPTDLNIVPVEPTSPPALAIPPC